jgi:hypothetical protein
VAARLESSEERLNSMKLFRLPEDLVQPCNETVMDVMKHRDKEV